MTTHRSAAAPPAASIAALEAEIGARRARLAASIDELVIRASPRNILHRQADAARARFATATRKPDGELRADRIGAVVAAAVVVGGVLAYRRFRRR
ncbi:MAG: DUF3618 domain-containing protein [Dermatophilaceae bacterium]